jgi:hypothetical protein
MASAWVVVDPNRIGDGLICRHRLFQPEADLIREITHNSVGDS